MPLGIELYKRASFTVNSGYDQLAKAGTAYAAKKVRRIAVSHRFKRKPKRARLVICRNARSHDADSVSPFSPDRRLFTDTPIAKRKRRNTMSAELMQEE